MRHNKYRGKSTLNGEWRKGDFITDVREFNRTCDKAYILPYWDKLNAPIQVSPETVGQFSGLKDTKGKEIYEKDVGVHFKKKFEVVFREGAFYGRQEGTHYYVLVYDLLADFVIIGNTCDNPEIIQ